MLRSIWTILVTVAATLFFGSAAIVGCLILRKGNSGVIMGGMWSRIILRAAGIRILYEGLDNRALDHSCVYIANHQSMVDIWALLPVLPRETRFVAKESLFRIPVLGWAIRAAGFIPIDRSNISKAMRSLEKAGAKIRAGNSVILFPEGTRSEDGNLRPFKKGAFHMALKARVPICPVTIQGSFQRLQPSTLRITPGEVVVHFGEALDTVGYTENSVNELKDELHRRIKSTLEELEIRSATEKEAAG